MRIEKTIFASVDKIREAIDAGKYKHITPCLLLAQPDRIIPVD